MIDGGSSSSEYAITCINLSHKWSRWFQYIPSTPFQERRYNNQVSNVILLNFPVNLNILKELSLLKTCFVQQVEVIKINTLNEGFVWNAPLWSIGCATVYKPVFLEDSSQRVFFVPPQSASKTAHHLLPMRGLFIPPIPLGDFTLAAHYPEAMDRSVPEAVLQSVICYGSPLSSAYPTLICCIQFI